MEKPSTMAAPPMTISQQPTTAMPTNFIQPALGPQNTLTVCQFCQASINTAVKYTNTSRTYIAAALCAGVCCLCCLPFCVDSTKNTDHYCPNCERYLGTYQK